MASKSKQVERVPLERFLGGLGAEAAEDARTAAERMRLNERIAGQLRGVERELAPFFITAGVSFLLGFVALLFFAHPGGPVDRFAGAWPIMIAALAFFPVMLVIYAVRIRKRSSADLENARLNQSYFLPHGAIYFPSDASLAEQMVTLVEVAEAPGGWRSKFERTRPGTIW